DERTGRSFPFSSYTISADLAYVLFALPGERVWRHSSKQGYMIFDLKTRRARPLSTSGPVNGISYATWSPTGHSILFVRDNDLYVNVNLQEERRVTWDGSEAIFNGIPDWIYEEEVYEDKFTVWWSPDSKHIAYLRLDETKVPVYHYAVYEDPGLPASSYPMEKSIKYPKPGYPNPIASVHLYSLDDTGSPGSGRRVTASTPVQPVNLGPTAFANDDRLLVEVAWAGPNNVLVRAMNRVQDISRLYLVPATPSAQGSHAAQMVREERGDVDGGWLDTRKSIHYLPPIPGRRMPGYIDVVIRDGFDHLAYFPALNASVPLYYLTAGPWEVTDNGVLAIDSSDRVWYVSTERGSTQRHLYSVGLDGQNKVAHTPNDGGYYEVDMSPHGGWYLLSYKGPDVPYDKLVRASRTPGGGQGPKPWERVLVDNQALRQRLSRYSMPMHRHGTFRTPDGVDLNYVEVLPPDFEQGVRQGKRYGVLMNVYGGPKSQMVHQQYGYDFHDALVSEMGTDFIVVTVDGRGTGFKGRAFRSLIRGRLGHYEVMDQVSGGRHWASLPYVNPQRIGIWGWSYGGFMSAKVVEANSGVFAAAMSVAPVTDWHFYDTVYTERYMKTPKLNPKGYQESAVTKMAGFHKTKYLLVHGLADDNVHFQQSAHLIDILTRAKVRNYRVQFFTDSDHSIRARGAHSEIYSLLRSFILQSMPPR
ncbi:dipeptidyl peptidase IV N-terminal region-domain-containing protein, partial [Piptocephalis cylindrospora]